jgi:hypothetical protein
MGEPNRKSILEEYKNGSLVLGSSVLCDGWRNRAIGFTIGTETKDVDSCLPCPKEGAFWVVTQVGSWNGAAACIPALGKIKPGTDSTAGLISLMFLLYMGVQSIIYMTRANRLR